MKEIYTVNSISKIYKIIKANYYFNINEFKIIKSSISLFNNFKDELLSSSNKYLNYEFAYKYLQQCTYCYHITYKDLNM